MGDVRGETEMDTQFWLEKLNRRDYWETRHRWENSVKMGVKK
jgi:hypothetical protein